MKHLLSGAIVALLLAGAACGPERQGRRAEKSCPKCPEVKAAPVRALVLGDRTGHPDDAVFMSVLRKAARMGPDLIISVGDLIQGYQPDSEIHEADAEWRAVMGMIRAVFGPDMPVFSAAGNHDVWSEKSEALFERYLGHRPNFSFEMGSARVILFDTSRVVNEHRIPDADLDWLVKELNFAGAYSSRIVFTHRTLWALTPGGTPGDPLHDVLIAGDADWVMSGHWHHVMADDRDGIRYRMIGTSGGRPNRPDHPESGNFQQFGWLVVKNGEVELSLLSIDHVHRSDAFPYAFNQLEHKIQTQAVVPEGFEIDPLSPKTNGEIHLRIANVSGARLEQPVRFSDNGWRITPNTRVPALSPGESEAHTVRFSRSADGPLFPGPMVSVTFDWPGGGEYQLKKSLPPTLTRPLRECASPPVLDGRFDDPCWKAAVPLGPVFEQRGKAVPGTDVRVVKSGDVLYIAAEIEHAESETKTYSARPRDTYLEDGDHFLVLVDGDPDNNGYLRIAVSRDGTLFDRRYGTDLTESEEMAWNGADAAVGRSEKGWTAELAIPLKPASSSEPRDGIGFNFSVKQVNGSRMSVGWWQPLLEHDRDAFGVLRR